MTAVTKHTSTAPGEWANDAACKRLPGTPEERADYMEVPQHDSRRKLGKAALEHIERARAVCLTCPVIDECLAWALEHRDNAYELMAGGMAPFERAEHLRHRKAMGL